MFWGVSISGVDATFSADGSEGQTGIYLYSGGSLGLVADKNTPAPDSSGNFTWIAGCDISIGNVMFLGHSPSACGIYIYSGVSLEVAVDTNTPLPGGTGFFPGCITTAKSPAISGTEVVCASSDPAAVYLLSVGSLAVAADTNTAIPGELEISLGSGTLSFLMEKLRS